MNAWQIVLALSSPVVAVAIAVWTLRRGDKTAKLRTLFELQERYTAAEARKGRQLIHGQISGILPAAVGNLEPETLAQVGSTLGIMNTIAVCVFSGLADETLLFQVLGRSYTGTIKAAAAYIEWASARRGYDAYRYAQALGNRFSTRS